MVAGRIFFGLFWAPFDQVIASDRQAKMPPKGWRKDAQGNYPTTSYIKEQESVTIHDLLFPRSVVTHMAKELNADAERKILLNKDTALALQRSSTVFVSHLFLFAREIAKGHDRKSCNVNDVYDALDQIGFGGFKSIINSKMIAYQEDLDLKKSLKSAGLSETADANDTEDEDRDAEEEEEEAEGELEASKRPRHDL